MTVVQLAVAIAVTLGTNVVHAGLGEAPARRVSTAQTHCPLTGLKAPKGVDVDRAAIAVKVDNNLEGSEASGLERADLVLETVVEGGVTRFTAIFHCKGGGTVGPVRSARMDDPALAGPFTNVLVNSGANDAVAEKLEARGMISVDEFTSDGALYRTTEDADDVDDLYADLGSVRDLLTDGDAQSPRAGVFEFGAAADGSFKATTAKMDFGATEVEYRFKNDLWKRYQDGAPFLTTSSGGPVAVPNVVIQRVTVNNSELVDAAGNPSPDHQLGAGGPAWLLRGGRLTKGTWSLDKSGAPQFVTKSGDPFVFAPGPIWIELVPSGDGDVTGSVTYK